MIKIGTFKVGDRIKHLPTGRLGKVEIIPPKSGSGFTMMGVEFDGDYNLTMCENSTEWFEICDDKDWKDIWDSGAT